MSPRKQSHTCPEPHTQSTMLQERIGGRGAALSIDVGTSTHVCAILTIVVNTYICSRAQGSRPHSPHSIALVCFAGKSQGLACIPRSRSTISAPPPPCVPQAGLGFFMKLRVFAEARCYWHRDDADRRGRVVA